jgi:Xaa-Pro aminopeptidase
VIKTRSAAFALLFAVLAGALTALADDKARAPGDQEDLKARAYSATNLHARRRALMKALPEGALVVLSSGRSTESDAVSHRANRDFLYLTGVEDPKCFLLIDGEREVLFAPPRDPRTEIWVGIHTYPGDETARRFGFDAALPVAEFEKALAAALEQKHPTIRVDGFQQEELKRLGLEGKTEGAASTIARLRQIKDEAELALMKRAAEVSAAAHIYCTRAIGPDRFEYEVQGLFEGACRFYGCETQAYPSIVGSGPNSCILHYSTDRRRMKAGDLILIDAAGECGGYAADVTRTLPVSGKFTEEQRRIYEIVLRAQDAGIAACVPGKTIRDVHNAAAKVLAAEGMDRYMPHGVSHWLGLDVHDAGDYAKPLAPGMVLTVEPGIYIAEKELGVRIEDDILVTEDGPVNLSGFAPRRVEDVEALMAKAKDRTLEMTALPPITPVPTLKKHKGRLY